MPPKRTTRPGRSLGAWGFPGAGYACFSAFRVPLESTCHIYSESIDKTLVPCIGGPCEGLGLLVEQPIPLEIEHEGGGRYLLEERGSEDDPDLVYVYDES